MVASLLRVRPDTSVCPQKPGNSSTEFHDYRAVERTTGLHFYFAAPYVSWERGSNENLNGLLRQYLPKRTRLAGLTQRRCDAPAQRLNPRPRKRLGTAPRRSASMSDAICCTLELRPAQFSHRPVARLQISHRPEALLQHIRGISPVQTMGPDFRRRCTLPVREVAPSTAAYSGWRLFDAQC